MQNWEKETPPAPEATEEVTTTSEGGQENTQTVSEGEGTQDAIAE